MNIANKNIDGGKPFDWGKTSYDYAKFRDIYPQEFYNKIIKRKLCVDGQTVLDIGTGTGVLPRNMYRYGAKWIGTDISENQIEQAVILSKGMNIDYYTMSAEDCNSPTIHLMSLLLANVFGILIMNRLCLKFTVCLNLMEKFLCYTWHGCLLKIELQTQARRLC